MTGRGKSSRFKQYAARCGIALLLLVPLAAFYGPDFVLQRTPSFRDAGHFYVPLYHWTGQQALSGRLPLWNPHENLGQPLVANPAAALFYPGRLLFLLPVGAALQFKLFLTGHVVLGWIGAYVLARRWKCSRVASGLAATAYVFSGAVLFQYSNVVYLVGAAWLPLAVLYAERVVRRPRLSSAAALGTILALMILGGDPQAAYHVLVLAGVYLIQVSWSRGFRWAGPGKLPGGLAGGTRTGLFIRSSGCLLLAALTMMALSAVQILPAADWARTSQRNSFVLPRSVWDLPAFSRHLQVEVEDRPTLVHGTMQGFFQDPPSGTHHEHIYHFSLGPWRLVELVWPNVFGRMFPTHHRWIDVLPAEGRVWTPSLYAGLLPLVLAMVGACSWRKSVRWRWAVAAACFALLASFGWYGLGWLGREIVHAFEWQERAPDVGAPVGGVYWLMVTLLPGYAMFRFPAKWLVLASLFIALLAGRGWDAGWRNPKLPRRLLSVIGCLSAAGLVAALAMAPWWDRWMEAAPGTLVFGPLQSRLAYRDFCGAWLHALVFGAAYRVLISKTFAKKHAVQGAALTLMLLDVTLANRWLIASSPDSLWSEPVAAARLMATDRALQPPENIAPDRRSAISPRHVDPRKQAAERPPLRVYRATLNRWVPPSWPQTASTDRQAEVIHWDRATLFPKHHLPLGISMIEVPGTSRDARYEALLSVGRAYGPRRSDAVAELPPSVLDSLGVQYVLAPESFQYTNMQRLEWPVEQHVPENFQLLENPQAFPPVWLVDRVTTHAPLNGRDWPSLIRDIEAVYFPGGRPRDFARESVVEKESIPHVRHATCGKVGNCSVVERRFHRLVIEADVQRPALLVVNDLFANGWRAWREDDHGRRLERLTIHRTNGVMRGVVLPAGEHRVVMQYRPPGLMWGGIITLCGWVALAFSCWQWRRFCNSPRRFRLLPLPLIMRR